MIAQSLDKGHECSSAHVKLALQAGVRQHPSGARVTMRIRAFAHNDPRPLACLSNNGYEKESPD
jgi:hypothetical protein